MLRVSDSSRSLFISNAFILKQQNNNSLFLLTRHPSHTHSLSFSPSHPLNPLNSTQQALTCCNLLVTCHHLPYICCRCCATGMSHNSCFLERHVTDCHPRIRWRSYLFNLLLNLCIHCCESTPRSNTTVHARLNGSVIQTSMLGTGFEKINPLGWWPICVII